MLFVIAALLLRPSASARHCPRLLALPLIGLERLLSSDGWRGSRLVDARIHTRTREKRQSVDITSGLAGDLEHRRKCTLADMPLPLEA